LISESTFGLSLFGFGVVRLGLFCQVHADLLQRTQEDQSRCAASMYGLRNAFG